jgi:2-keto-4-pentenoate hydratase/2-oxohepta-3-ene-1,7-dioic acid hydratase in catechol pathway
LSRATWILTGTPNGARFNPPKWLVPGDLVEVDVDVEVEGIGVLSNSLADEVTA